MGSQTCFLALLALITCTVRSAAVAQTCSPSDSTSMISADITTLIDQLKSGNYDYADPFSDAPMNWVSFTYSTTKFCVQNTNSDAFDSTSVALAEVAAAATSVCFSCCRSSVCQGGNIVFTPAYGPQLNLVVAPSDWNCGRF